MSQKRKAADEQQVIIAIDFGTTYSGVSYATTSRPDLIETVTSWNCESAQNADRAKCPTTVCYDKHGRLLSWGYEESKGRFAPKWFKLLLLDENNLSPATRSSSMLRESREVLQNARKGCVEVVADYVSELWKHCLDKIRRSLGPLLEISVLKVIVTLPAIWPTYAHLRMREALEVAGILDSRLAGETTVDFVSEPEAAALATLDDMTCRPDIERDDHFVVCDAGGGTVDLISYHVKRSNPLRVRESVQGEGGLCGASFIDEAFGTLLQDATPRDVWERVGDSEVSRITESTWEHVIKPQFSDSGRPWPIQVQYQSATPNLYATTSVHLSNDQIKAVFEPVVQQVISLVQNQVNRIEEQFGKRPRFIILVGGFGRSRYLYNRLGQVFDSTHVLQGAGERPWKAVSRGAVLKGLMLEKMSNSIQVTLESRVARASYGTLANIVPFDEKEHDPADREWDPTEGKFVAADQVRWFLKKGDRVPDGERALADKFWQNFLEEPKELESDLVYSDAPEPPNRCDPSVKTLQDQVDLEDKVLEIAFVEEHSG